MPNLITVLLEKKHGYRLPCVYCHCWFYPYQLGVFLWHSGPCKRCKVDKKCLCIKEFKPHLLCKDCEEEGEWCGEICCRYDVDDDDED
jgi:hypothetical protein